MIFGLFSGRGLQGLVYTLFGVLVLSTLWVTSLSVLSAPAPATDLLTQAGTQILNPFLVDHNLGLSQTAYSSLEASARSDPSKPLDLSVLNVRVLGREIRGLNYPDTVHLIFGRVAKAYYNGGAKAAFAIPHQLQQELPNFALFNPDNIPLIPGGPKVPQLPPFLQPLFVFTGLTPATFTASGHKSLLHLLPWFWGVTIVLGLLAVVLNRTGQKLIGLAKSVIHAAWPIVAILVGLWVLSRIATKSFAPYTGILGDVRGAFLPVYGGALLLGLASLGLLARLSRARPSTAGAGKRTSASFSTVMPETSATPSPSGVPWTGAPERVLGSRVLIGAADVSSVLREPVRLDTNNTPDGERQSLFGTALPQMDVTTMSFTGTRSNVNVIFSLAQGAEADAVASQMFDRLRALPGIQHVTGLGDDAYEAYGRLIVRQGTSCLMIAISQASSSPVSAMEQQLAKMVERQLAQMVLNTLQAS